MSPGREWGQAAGGSGESWISFFRPRGHQRKPDPGQAWVIPTDRCDPSGRRPAGQHRQPLHSHLGLCAHGGDEGSSSARARPGTGRGMTTPASTQTWPQRSSHEQAAGASGRGQGPATLLTQRRNDSSSSHSLGPQGLVLKKSQPVLQTLPTVHTRLRRTLLRVGSLLPSHRWESHLPEPRGWLD